MNPLRNKNVVKDFKTDVVNPEQCHSVLWNNHTMFFTGKKKRELTIGDALKSALVKIIRIANTVN